MEDKILVEKLAHALFDKKAEQIIALDLRGLSMVSDYMILANGNVGRHVQALSVFLEKLLKEEKRLLCIEGKHISDWIVLDAGTIMIHLFTKELRDKYRLESLWKQAKIIPITFKETGDRHG